MASTPTVYQQLFEPHPTNNPMMYSRMNISKDESTIEYGNKRNENLFETQSDYDRPIKIKIDLQKGTLLQQYEQSKQTSQQNSFVGTLNNINSTNPTISMHNRTNQTQNWNNNNNNNNLGFPSMNMSSMNATMNNNMHNRSNMTTISQNLRF